MFCGFPYEALGFPAGYWECKPTFNKERASVSVKNATTVALRTLLVSFRLYVLSKDLVFKKTKFNTLIVLYHPCSSLYSIGITFLKLITKIYSKWTDTYFLFWHIISVDGAMAQRLRVCTALIGNSLSLSPAPMLGSSQLPGTPVSGDRTVWVHTQYRQIV